MQAETNQLGLEFLVIEDRVELDWVCGCLHKAVDLGHSLLAHLELSAWFEDKGTPRYPLVLSHTDARLAIQAMKNRRTTEDELAVSLLQ